MKVLCGNCNAGVTSTSTKGELGMFDMWVNDNGIANLISVPQLEKDGFHATTDTLAEWLVYTPQG